MAYYDELHLKLLVLYSIQIITKMTQQKLSRVKEINNQEFRKEK